MSTLERAVEIAAKAHAGAVDKAGMPYLLHPLRVMLSMSLPEDRIAAVLHDVVEDTPVTMDELKRAGFSTTVLEAVEALTKQPGESRIESATRASRVPIARRVKLADVTDNMDLSRIAHVTERDLARVEEYRQVRRLLEESAEA